jgi:hypothetical protein
MIEEVCNIDRLIDSENNIYNVSKNGNIDPVVPKGTIITAYSDRRNSYGRTNGVIDSPEVVLGISRK